MDAIDRAIAQRGPTTVRAAEMKIALSAGLTAQINVPMAATDEDLLHVYECVGQIVTAIRAARTTVRTVALELPVGVRLGS